MESRDRISEASGAGEAKSEKEVDGESESKEEVQAEGEATEGQKVTRIRSDAGPNQAMKSIAMEEPVPKVFETADIDSLGLKYGTPMRMTLLTMLFCAALYVPRVGLGQSARWVPEDAQQLFAVLVGTVWAADGKPEESYTFLSDGHFKGSALQPTYTITGRRMLIMHWAPDTNIRCLINEECSAMTELGGERHTFIRVP